MGPADKPASEIGVEMLAHELTPETVVVLAGTHRPDHAVTAWVTLVTPHAVAFHAGTLKMTLALRVNDKGEMFDALNHRIKAYKYLGEV